MRPAVRLFLSVSILFYSVNGFTAENISLKLCKALFGKNLSEYVDDYEDRPEVDDLLKASEEISLSYNFGKLDENDAKFLRVMEEVLFEILEDAEGREIFFFARDGEWLYDGLRAMTLANKNSQAIDKKIHLINLSRPVVENSTDKQLLTYLEENGINPREIRHGRQRMIWVDSGERGTIYKKLLQVLVGTIPEGAKDWFSQVSMIFSGVEPRLVHSIGPGNLQSIKNKISKLSEFDRDAISELIEGDLTFEPYLVGKYKTLGIPKEHNALHDWIVESMERRSHWYGRAQTLTKDGTRIKTYEDIDQDQAAALASQAVVIRYFLQDNVVSRFEKVFREFASAKMNHDSDAKDTGKDTSKETDKDFDGKYLKVKQFAKQNLIKGMLVVTPAGRKLRIGKFIDEGKRGKVFMAEDIAKSKKVILKVAVNLEEETLESFKDESAKQKAYAKSGWLHAKLLELGDDYMVKDFIDGDRADAWVKKWEKSGLKPGTEQLVTLKKQIRKAASNGVYIGDLNPKNLIWDGKAWIIIDSGDAKTDMSERKILKRFYEKILDRWAKHFDEATAAVLSEELKDLKDGK